MTAGAPPGESGCVHRDGDNLATFNPDLPNPLLTGRTNPETGKPFIGAFELVASDNQPERSLRKNPWQVAPRVGVAYRLTDSTVLRAGGGTFYVPSTTRFQDGPTNNPVNNRTNNIATSIDNNRTFFTDLSNPFPTGVDNYPGRDPSFQQVLLGGTATQFYRDEEGYPGRTSAVQRGVAASVHEYLLGRSGVHRAARHASPQYPEPESAGARVHRSRRERPDRLQPDGERDHSAGSARLHVVTARHLLRGVPAPDGAESSRGGGARGRACRRPRCSARSCSSSSRSTHRPTSRDISARAATTRCSCGRTSASARAAW